MLSSGLTAKSPEATNLSLEERAIVCSSGYLKIRAKNGEKAHAQMQLENCDIRRWRRCGK